MAISASERYALDLLRAWHMGEAAPCICEGSIVKRCVKSCADRR